MHRRWPGVNALTLAIVALPLLPMGANAQLAVSANDNKSANSEGRTVVIENAPPDTVTIVNLGVSPPKIIGELKVPASVVGPPNSVAVARDESYALVTGAFKIDPADPKKVVPDDKLTVIDLKSSPPAVLATLPAGMGASGVSINRAGTLALVANRSEGTISVFTIANRTLTPVGKIQLGDAKSGPSHVAFTPDGKMALVTRDGDHRISVLSIDGAKVEDTKRFMVASIRLTVSLSAQRVTRGADQPGRRAGRQRRDQRHRPETKSAAHCRQHHRRPDSGRCHHVARWHYVAITIQNGWHA